MPIFRPSAAPAIPLVVSVTGVRLGQRVLVVPGRDRKPLLEIAARVGLTGRTLALTSAQDAPRVQAEAERAGVLVDLAVLEMPMPVSDDTFDLALVDDRAERGSGLDIASLLPGLRAALRPGGRLVVLLQAGGGRLGRLFGGSEPPPAAAALLEALTAAGLRAGRLVTVRDGVGFVEASTPSA